MDNKIDKLLMKKIYIWGVGYYAEYIYSVINREQCIIKGFIDSDKEKQGKLEKGLMIYAPDQLLEFDYDYVILSMIKYEPVEEICDKLEIPKEKVISYWKDSESTGIFRSRALEILEEQKNTIKYKYRLDSAPYEWGLKEVPLINSADILLKKIISDGSSLCRFGDGEFEIMRGNERPWFQDTSASLKDRLIEVINSRDTSINIAIAQNFVNLERFKEDAADIIRKYMAGKTREDIIKFLDMERTYYDAYVTRPYILFKTEKNAQVIFPLFKKIWKNRSLIIVEGKYGRNGVNNDFFNCAKSIRRIICPPRNAWSVYEKIKRAVEDTADKSDLICISLGPTATVLAYDMAKRGYQAMDIGQVDNEYDWYSMRATERQGIEGKMVAEITENGNLENFKNAKYCSQIVSEIY